MLAPAALAQRLGVAELVDAHVRLPVDAVGRANGGTKAMTVIGAMLAGADSIADVDVLRAGAGPELFDDGRAPSTIGTWLRGFIWASVRMLDRVSRRVLARAWQAGLGPDLDADLTVDFDSTICQTYGTGKQGARFGYTGVRGYHPLLATLADTGEVLHARMRGGNAGAARGAGTFVRETCRRIRGAGATGKLTFRADSAFYSRAFVTACRDHDVAFSVTVKLNRAIRRAIDQIDESAWMPIPYWLDDGADVAETTHTAFAGTRDAVDLRLIVRRVRPTPGSQLALDVVYDHHAILTDRHGPTLEVEADHRAHAVVELAIRDLKAGGLAPALRHLHRERRLACPGMPGPQPGPLDPGRRRRPMVEGDHRNAAHQAGVDARPARTLRQTSPAPRTDELALARPVRNGTGQDRSDPRTDLTGTPPSPTRHRPQRPRTPTSPGPSACPHPGPKPRFGRDDDRDPRGPPLHAMNPTVEQPPPSPSVH
ncbi:MAG: IS1380 family transposase, partial [Nitriliruptoraceae bacterium]